jgi:hypothetical protein
MREHIWDCFVEAMMVLFMPLVCSYFTLTADLFFTVSAQDAKGLEWVSNQLLTPVQYLLDGQEASQKEDGSWEFTQKFNYKDKFWLKTIGSITTLPPSLLLGSFFKAASLLSTETRARYISLKQAKQSTAIKPHTTLYRQLGIPEQMEPEFLSSLGFKRRPGDENALAAEKRAMKEITELLTQSNIPWWVDCGTCLGAYRYGGVIPWDEDIDLAVLQIDFDNILHILNQLDRKKYLVQDWSTRDHPKSFIKVYIRESGTMIDIYHFDIDFANQTLNYIFSLESHLFFPEWFKIRERRFKAPAPFEIVFPLKKMNFDGLEIFVPNDIKRYLQRCYGENLDPVKIYDPITNRYEKDLNHPYWRFAYTH